MFSMVVPSMQGKGKENKKQNEIPVAGPGRASKEEKMTFQPASTEDKGQPQFSCSQGNHLEVLFDSV